MLTHVELGALPVELGLGMWRGAARQRGSSKLAAGEARRHGARSQ